MSGGVSRSGSNSSLPPDVDLTTQETREAKALLKDEAKDGAISTAEIKAAEREIAAKYGAEKGKAILIAALGVNPAKIEFKAVDYLQGRVGSMDGHVARYQDVLVAHLKGAKILDANFDGRLDPNDLVFT